MVNDEAEVTIRSAIAELANEHRRMRVSHGLHGDTSGELRPHRLCHLLPARQRLALYHGHGGERPDEPPMSLLDMVLNFIMRKMEQIGLRLFGDEES